VDRKEVADPERVRSYLQPFHELPCATLRVIVKPDPTVLCKVVARYFGAASPRRDEQGEKQKQRQGEGGESSHLKVLSVRGRIRAAAPTACDQIQRAPQ
jgi:hypothetical protein